MRQQENFRQLIRNLRKLGDAQLALNQLAYRLRDDGPEMSREQIRDRVKFAIDKLNEFHPQSPLRTETE